MEVKGHLFGMLFVVQTQAADSSNAIAGQGRQELVDVNDVFLGLHALGGAKVRGPVVLNALICYIVSPSLAYFEKVELLSHGYGFSIDVDPLCWPAFRLFPAADTHQPREMVHEALMRALTLQA